MRENNIDWYYIYSKIHIYTYERGNERESWHHLPKL